MAIKYNTKTGDALLNQKAAAQRDYSLKPLLKNMKCKNCGGDSTISFGRHQVYPGSGSVDWHLEACCPSFEAEINAKLGRRG
jgi:hypothetical protein